jgi:pyruvate dehydrogenase E1 component alpha subunit
MNFAGIHRLPEVFVLENNQFAYSTPNELEFAVDPVDRAVATDSQGERRRQRRRGRLRCGSRSRRPRPRGEGPTLIECWTMRMHGHGAHDDMSYVPDELFEEWRGRDPIERYEHRLAEEHGFDSDELAEIRRDAEREVAEAAETALASPMPDPELATDGVVADRWEPLGDGDAPWSRWSDEPSGNGHVAAHGNGATDGRAR